MQESETTLLDTPIGARVIVREVRLDDVTRVRLLEIGVMPGAGVMRVRHAPLGCPVEVDVAGSRFSLRKEVVAAIVVGGAP